MIEDMTIRRFGEHTQRDHVRQVREFTAFLGLPPDRAGPEDLRRYQLHMVSLGASFARMNLACTALRFFFHVTLGRTGFGDRMARIPTPDRLPVVLDTQEVALLLAHARSLKDRAALSIAYGCGLRVSEIANLKVADIDSARMLIRVTPPDLRYLGIGQPAPRMTFFEQSSFTRKSAPSSLDPRVATSWEVRARKHAPSMSRPPSRVLSLARWIIMVSQEAARSRTWACGPRNI